MPALFLYVTGNGGVEDDFDMNITLAVKNAERFGKMCFQIEIVGHLETIAGQFGRFYTVDFQWRISLRLGECPIR